MTTTDDIIRGIQQGFQHTNIAPVDISGYRPAAARDASGATGANAATGAGATTAARDTAHLIACIIDAAPRASNQAFDGMFSPIKSYFIHKMIDQSTVVQPFRLRSDDFFKGALYVDYLCNALLGSHGFLASPDRGSGRGAGAPRTLNDLVMASAATFPDVRRNADRDAYHTSHNIGPGPYTTLRQPKATAALAAQILLDMTASDLAKRLYGTSKGVMDLKAAFFIDCAISVIETPRIDAVTEAITQAHGRGGEREGHYQASLAALAELYRQGSERVVRGILNR